MDYTISEDEMKKLAEELNLKVSFGNPPEKTGVKIGAGLIRKEKERFSMREGSRFIVCEHFHDERYARQTGVIVEVEDNNYYVSKVLFDEPLVQAAYIEEEDMRFEMLELFPSCQKGNRDIEFEDKLKEALTSLLEREILEISSNLGSDYDGKTIETKVLIDGEVVYSKVERVNITF